MSALTTSHDDARSGRSAGDRRAPADRRRPARPVISIGNLAMGGRGKTPLVALVAGWLVEAGERPAILSRGYRRRRPEPGVVVVSDGRRLLADLDRSGDEPLMLARRVRGAAVLVSPVRSLGAAVAETALGATVLLLDDGFQHRALARDVDVVVVTAGDLRDRRLPLGRLRSPVSALARADAVIVDGPLTEDVQAAIARHRPDRDPETVFALVRTLGSPRPVEAADDVPRLDEPVIAAAGIAAPDRFATALAAAGWQVRRTLRFADHHAYDRRDLSRMTAALDETGGRAVLTTEKDAVRLLPLRPLPVPVSAVPLDVAVEPADRFRGWMFERLRAARQ